MKNSTMRSLCVLAITLVIVVGSGVAHAAIPAEESSGDQATDGGKPWWFWPPVLFVFCFALGILAVMAGVGGGVL